MWNAKNKKLYRAGKWFPRAEVRKTIGNDKWPDWAQALALKMCVYFECSYCNFTQHGWIDPQVGYIQGASTQLQCLLMSIPCPAAQLCPFKCCCCPSFMLGIGHTCRGPGIRNSYPSISGQGMGTSIPEKQHLGKFGKGQWEEWVIGEAGVESEEVEGKASISPSRTQVPINPSLEVAIS